jgi:hypothetical protein
MFLLALGGCHRGHVEEAEHHTPAHKPADVPAAVDRLLELHIEIVNEHLREPSELDAFTEAYDVARWLPELAADSDLPEGPWNKLDRAASDFVGILVALLRVEEDEARRAAYHEQERMIEQVHRELIAIRELFDPSGDVATVVHGRQHE